jgi:hypothetical protein
MYASGKSEGLLTCEWCKVKHWSVKLRTVLCGDDCCRCEYDAVVCKPCAEKTYE